MTKVTASEGLRPRSLALESEGSESSESNQGVKMKKELSLMNGVAIIVGVIVGAGIFVSPKLALESAGSKGMSLIVWASTGLLAMIGALCYSELGTMIPKSGGDYAYLHEAFGPLPAFLYLWAALFILAPTGNAITALTFAQNVLQPLWPECEPPKEAVILIAAFLMCSLTLINCYNVKWVTRLQDSFTVAKILALIVIFFASLWYLYSGHTENLQNMMRGTTTDPSKLAIAFYSGLFSYSGWNYLNFVTEELKDPFRNLPRAVCISMPIVTLVYTLTNVAFFAVLTNSEILIRDAVGVTFAIKILGVMAWIMPLFIALCTVGSLNGAIYASSRLFFVGARNGHLPVAISLIDVKRLTPVPSLILMCLVTMMLLLSNNVTSLLVCLTAVEATFNLLSILGLLWLRRTQPKLVRPIRINLFFPILFTVVCAFIIVCSFKSNFVEVAAGMLFVLLGIPFYYVFITWQNKPQWLLSSCNSVNLWCSKFFLCLPENSKEL